MATYDLNAPKRATNVSVNSDLLRQAKELGVNVSALVERSLATLVGELKAQRWEKENALAIDAYNTAIAKSGLWNDEPRHTIWMSLGEAE